MTDREINALRMASGLPPITSKGIRLPPTISQTGRNRSSIKLEVASFTQQRLIIRTHISTGTPEGKTQPGIAFEVATLYHPSETEDGFRIDIGVMGRDEVRAIRNLLTEFMLDFPEDDPKI